jgi:hypothetical protein
MSAKNECKGDGRGNSNDLRKTNEFNRPWEGPYKNLRPHHVDKVDEKHQKDTNDPNPLEGSTE